MIIVNSPGNQTPYRWLEHSLWNGCSLADFVFPFFIFIVGITTVLSLSKVPQQRQSLLLFKILKRSLLIFLIGLFLNAFPNHFDLGTLRILGVLQRIALCYFLSAILFLTTGFRAQALITAILLISYWLVMTLTTSDLTREGNFAAYLDRLLLSADHLYGKTYDPEGFLSTLPALATTLLGSLTAAWLLSSRDLRQKGRGLIWAGILALGLGWCWGLVFPINKTLWTSSFVLWTGGWALLIFAFCYWTIEIKNYRKWSKPLEIFGLNALMAYVLSILFLKMQLVIQIPRPGGFSLNLKSYLCDYLFGWASPENAALLYALAYTLIWFLVLVLLYRRKIIIKL